MYINALKAYNIKNPIKIIIWKKHREKKIDSKKKRYKKRLRKKYR